MTTADVAKNNIMSCAKGPMSNAEALQAISDALKSIADIPPLAPPVPEATVIENPPQASLARKRRREKMRSNNGSGAVDTPHVLPPTVKQEMNNSNNNENSNRVPPKKRKVSLDLPSTNNIGPDKTRTQMRYDPDVPMTKEEVTAWRREARRVRNRESAAASRAKTRDRIAELEAEVDEWKQKYEALRRDLLPLQQQQRQEASLLQEQENTQGETSESVNKNRHVNEKILRPAVKIAGAVLFLDPTPDLCISLSKATSETSLEPNPVSSSDESSKDGDNELEDFVVDAFLDSIELPDMQSCLSNGVVL